MTGNAASAVETRNPRGWGWRMPGAPFVRSGQSHAQILAAWTMATMIVALAGIVLYGLSAAQVIAVAALTALATEASLSALAMRQVPGGLMHALVTGVLLGLTLPPTAPWFVAAAGGFLAILVAKWMFGGFGHHLWHPAVAGRVIVQFLFAQHLSFSQGLVQTPILAPGHLLVGQISAAVSIPAESYQGWSNTPLEDAPRAEAFLLERPVQVLRRMASGSLDVGFAEPWTTLLRDYLPPWKDTVLGTVPGGVGESCTIALVVVGMYLIYRGHLRWQVPVCVLASAALTAAILPVAVPHSSGALRMQWLPALVVEDKVPVGAAYVLYHVTAGQLMLCAFLLAGDMLAGPLTVRGQRYFAVGVGVIAMLMRLYGVLEGECYWAILIMNTFVPAIDRRTRRRPLAVEPAA